jgi:hypothetical protein
VISNPRKGAEAPATLWDMAGVGRKLVRGGYFTDTIRNSTILLDPMIGQGSRISSVTVPISCWRGFR